MCIGVPIAVGACGAEPGPAPVPDPEAAGAAGPEQATARDFDRRRFTHPTRVDNAWLPLVPGRQFVYVGRANRGDGRRPHRVVFTVTDLTKVIDGVRTRVIWDRDVNAGALREGELAFMAQDDDGNVWNFGEYPEEYVRGRFHGAPDTWIVGRAGARAGIGMRAHPRTRTSSYLQGLAPKIDFADRAKVVGTGGRTCVPGRCYRDVLEIDEWNPDEPGAHQSKFYAPGVGNVRVGAAGGDEQEVLVLARVKRLRPRGPGPRAPPGARARAARLPGAPGALRPHPAGAVARRGHDDQVDHRLEPEVPRARGARRGGRHGRRRRAAAQGARRRPARVRAAVRRGADREPRACRRRRSSSC